MTQPADKIMSDLAAAATRELNGQQESRVLRAAVNAHLIGQPGARHRLNTPALLIDLDLMLDNLAIMAGRCARARIALRPHAKTHKCAPIARLQVAAGASGICVAKIGEAEALADEGIGRILITSPIAGQDALRRFMALAGRVDELILAIDCPEFLKRLEMAAQQGGQKISFVIDVDVGLKRTGTNDPAVAVEMARVGTASSHLSCLGIQAYGGHLQHIEGCSARSRATAQAMAPAQEIIEQLRMKGLSPKLITGGGTGTHQFDIAQTILNEVQAGSYLFMDSQYNHALADENTGGFELALRVQTTVISANAREWFTVDGGTKSFATDGPAPEVLSPRFSGADFMFMGDEHGVVLRADGFPQPELGERIEFAAPHCDPTVNLYDFYHLVRGNDLIGIWPVTARGASF